MKLEPIMTVADLQAMGPSRALRKAVEAYPDVTYCWSHSTDDLRETGAGCAAGLLAVACGVDCMRDLGPAPARLLNWFGSSHWRVLASLSMGNAVSSFACVTRAQSFKAVIKRLEKVGL